MPLREGERCISRFRRRELFESFLELYPDSTCVLKCEGDYSFEGRYWIKTFRYKGGGTRTSIWVLRNEDMFVSFPYREYVFVGHKTLKWKLGVVNNKEKICEKFKRVGNIVF